MFAQKIDRSSESATLNPLIDYPALLLTPVVLDLTLITNSDFLSLLGLTP
jgi:hypothetical protein